MIRFQKKKYDYQYIFPNFLIWLHYTSIAVNLKKQTYKYLYI